MSAFDPLQTLATRFTMFGMQTDDFIYLNVRSLLSHYSNPSAEWPEKARALAETQVSFFRTNQLLRPDFDPLAELEHLVLRFSEFTPEGQAFLMSQAVERWLASCDRKGTVDAYRDAKGLQSRLVKFRAQRQLPSG